MIGILTEKPSAARNFAKALGGKSGTYNGESFVIANLRGHVYGFVKDPSSQVPASVASTYKSWALENLPWDETMMDWKRKPKDDAKDLIKQMCQILSGCDEIAIATDVDPSGEGGLLAWEFLLENNLQQGRTITRIYFPDEAVKSLQNGFTKRSPITDYRKDKEYLMADFRCKWDYLSMQWTRIATTCGDGHSVLRQGRLKSAMVQMVGDALKAIANYKKIPYYQNRFKDENGIVYTNPNEPMFKTKGEVPQTYMMSPVILDKKEIKHTGPKKLLDLAGLSAILSSRGVKAKTVLSTYQKMYEAQVVSYPRTEDKVITPEQFNELLPLVDKIAGVVGVDVSLLTHRTPRSTHVKTGGSHGANRPGTNVPASLDSLVSYGDCAPAIYEILAKNYLAMLAEDYEYEHQTGHLEKYPDFKGTANMPLKQGWKQVFSDVDDDMDDSSKPLGTTANPYIYEGFPTKPPTPTMRWLMKGLEQRNVGTGATRTSTYAEVTNSVGKYPLLVEKRGKLSMTEFGEMSYRLLPGTHIGSLDLTESVWKQMKDIADGKASADECLHEIQQMILDDIAVMKQNGVTMRKELNIMDKQPTEKEKFKGIWNGKEVVFNRKWSEHRFTDEECEALCRGEEIEVNGLISKKTGKEYGVVGKLEIQTYNGHKFVGFKRTGFAGRKGVPDEWCKHVFTQDEKDALEAGQTIEIEGCISKKGNAFNCKVRFGKNEKGFDGIIPEFD